MPKKCFPHGIVIILKFTCDKEFVSNPEYTGVEEFAHVQSGGLSIKEKYLQEGESAVEEDIKTISLLCSDKRG